MQYIPQFVVKRLQRTVAEAGSHPDADLLTAFAEQSLSGADRSFVVEHLARCGDCRDVVGMALPEMETVVHGVPSRGFEIGWLCWPALRWGAIAAGVLAIASFGVFQYEHKDQKTTVASSTVQDSLVEHNVAVASKLPATAAPTTQPARVEGRKELADASKSGLARFASGRRTSSANSGMVGADAADGRDQIAENRVDLPMNRSALDLDIVKAKNPVPLAMDGAQWAVAGGELERSFDRGKTWEKVDPIAVPESASAENAAASGESLQEAASVPGAKLVFRCVTAAGSEVWAGGSAGVFFHSADGGTSWTRVVPSSAGMSLTAEITSIQFSDAQHGVVTTSTGELWATADAGQTWRKQ